MLVLAATALAFGRAQSAASTTISVAALQVPRAVHPLIMGCHSDSGFAVQPFGFESQMIVGESFEVTGGVTWPTEPQPNISWNHVADGDALFVTDNSTVFHGFASQKISMLSGTHAAVTNRGLHNEGLVLHAGRDYHGYVFVKAVKPTTLTVALRNYATGEKLAAVDLLVAGSPDWVRHNFSLTPSASTGCEYIPFGSDPRIQCFNSSTHLLGPGHSCQRCAGEVSLGLSAAGDTVHLDFAALHPGEWGRFAGLEVRRDAVEALKTMGVTAIRQGGSFSDPTMDYWKRWRGRKWARASMGSAWRESYESSWGPFELIDLAVAAGMEPIVATTAQGGASGKAKGGATLCCNATDMADLVEYCWGDAYTTAWGRLRAADGHPEPYRLKYIELGNEQYNHLFLEQVRAMEARAAAVGIPATLHYIFPDNPYLNKGDDLAQAEAMGLRDRLITDLHVGATGGVAMARQLFAGMNTTAGAMNAEVNAGIHTMERALTEAVDLNAFFNFGAGPEGGRVKGRMASFCMERSGHLASDWDQGLAFFSADQMWLQPPGFVHKMIGDAWQPMAAAAAVVSSSLGCSASLPSCPPAAAGLESLCCREGVSASASADGRNLTVRYVNPTNVSVAVSVQLPAAGANASWKALDLTVLSSPDLGDGNPATDVLRVSPQTSELVGSAFVAPVQSFAVLRFWKEEKPNPRPNPN
jgi:hypothetical protein